jgi:hypothetical protein
MQDQPKDRSVIRRAITVVITKLLFHRDIASPFSVFHSSFDFLPQMKVMADVCDDENDDYYASTAFRRHMKELGGKLRREKEKECRASERDIYRDRV